MAQAASRVVVVGKVIENKNFEAASVGGLFDSRRGLMHQIRGTPFSSRKQPVNDRPQVFGKRS